VRRKPRVALLATGDELVRPGEPIGPNQIVSSNSLAVGAFVRACGGDPIDLGIAKDNRQSLESMARGAKGADLLVTIGGASVGDYDLVQAVLGDSGLEVDFWKVAMRPGKPLMFGHIGDTAMLGLPGNPVSALVCSLLFVNPAIAALLGLPDTGLPLQHAVLGCDLPENGVRQDYLRSTLADSTDGLPVVTPFAKQDSSMLSRLAAAHCLIVRPPHAPAAAKGSRVDILRLGSDTLAF
jgi:molybdopterin molybdotransferase